VFRFSAICNLFMKGKRYKAGAARKLGLFHSGPFGIG
jgi:hypothetical protein